MAAKKKSKKREAMVRQARVVRLILDDPDVGVHAVLKWDGSSTRECDGTWLTYSDVQWLAQAMPEILNEMERRGLDD